MCPTDVTPPWFATLPTDMAPPPSCASPLTWHANPPLTCHPPRSAAAKYLGLWDQISCFGFYPLCMPTGKPSPRHSSRFKTLTLAPRWDRRVWFVTTPTRLYTRKKPFKFVPQKPRSGSSCHFGLLEMILLPVLFDLQSICSRWKHRQCYV